MAATTPVLRLHGITQVIGGKKITCAFDVSE